MELNAFFNSAVRNELVEYLYVFATGKHYLLINGYGCRTSSYTLEFSEPGQVINALSKYREDDVNAKPNQLIRWLSDQCKLPRA